MFSRVRAVVRRLIAAGPRNRADMQFKLEKLFESGLSEELRQPITYLVSGATDSETDSVAAKVESRRAQIAAGGDRQVDIWYSPKPGSGSSDDGQNRPQPGKVLKFTMAKIASTGKDKRWGTFLYLLARSFRSVTVLELGSCAGISAYYLSSAPSVGALITVEGSESLARISEETLAEVSQKCRVVNSLFDEAIDSELPRLRKAIDFVYIDGHHEKVATLHYFERVLPYLQEGALVAFDDISWSYDMREAWEVLRTRREFSHAIDLGIIGVCQLKQSRDMQGPPRIWDLRAIVGEPSIGNPQGWKD